MFTPATMRMGSAERHTIQVLELRREQALRLTVTRIAGRRTRLDTLRRPGREEIQPVLRELIITTTLIATAMSIGTPAAVGISTITAVGTAFRTARERSLSIMMLNLVSRAISAQPRHLGVRAAGVVVSADLNLIAIAMGLASVVEVCLTEVVVEVCLVVVVGIVVAVVSVVAVLLEEVGAEVISVDFVVASVVFADGDNLGSPFKRAFQ
jgi:hypothetical protein